MCLNRTGYPPNVKICGIRSPMPEQMNISEVHVAQADKKFHKKKMAVVQVFIIDVSLLTFDL